MKNNAVIDQLFERKSVRVYEDRPVEEAVRRTILAAAIQAPTAGNMALYTILDITDPAMKAALAESCDHQPFIAQAPMVLIFCADYQRWYDFFRARKADTRVPGMGDLFLAQTDAIIAAQNAVVAAHSLGLGSCYIGDILEQYEYHRDLLKLPQYVVPTAMVCFGYPTQQQMERPKPTRFEVDDLVHVNGYDMEKSAAMPRMLENQLDVHGAALEERMDRFRMRKWDCDFSREMTRSSAAMAQAWCAGAQTKKEDV